MSTPLCVIIVEDREDAILMSKTQFCVTMNSGKSTRK